MAVGWTSCSLTTCAFTSTATKAWNWVLASSFHAAVPAMVNVILTSHPPFPTWAEADWTDAPVRPAGPSTKRPAAGVGGAAGRRTVAVAVSLAGVVDG